jgi:hypothetical protein
MVRHVLLLVPCTSGFVISAKPGLTTRLYPTFRINECD